MVKNISYLNGFRGYAAFWVMAAHCAIWGGVKGAWIPNPKIAVDIFMVMSGFLMAYTVMQRESIEPFTKPSSWLRFYVRRYFRLAPAYYVALFAAVVLAGPFLGGYAELRALNPEHWGSSNTHNTALYSFNAANIISHVTFVFGLIPKYVSSTGLPDWSLGLEMQFYLIFPLLYVGMRRFGHIPVCILLVAFTGMSMVALRGVFPEPSFILLKLHLFLIGMLLCEAFHQTGVDSRRRIANALFAFALSFIQVRTYRLEAITLIASISIIISLEVNAPAVKRLNCALRAVLGNRLTKFMAEMSYSVYLVHGFFLAILGAYLYRQPAYAALAQWERFVILLILVTIGTYSLAYLLDRFVEQPGIRLGKKLAKGISPAAFSEQRAYSPRQ